MTDKKIGIFLIQKTNCFANYLVLFPDVVEIVAHLPPPGESACVLIIARSLAPAGM